MDILFITDQNYLNPTAVAMLSVCESNKNEQLCFHVLTSLDNQPHDYDILYKIADSHNQKLIVYKQDFSKYEKLLPIKKDGMPSHCSIATYYRLFISDILPHDIDTILYLDSDVIVRGPLSGLFQNPSDEIAIEGVIDNWEGDITKFNRLRYNPSFRYINAGVLVIHLNYWRSNNVLSSFLRYIKEFPEQILHHDQDILNHCLFDKKAILSFRYNVQDGFLMKHRNFLYYDVETVFEYDIEHPVIIHYCSSSKPWHKRSKHPYTSEYRKYMTKLCLSIRDFPPKKLSLKEYLITTLVFLKIRRNMSPFKDNLKLV